LKYLIRILCELKSSKVYMSEEKQKIATWNKKREKPAWYQTPGSE